MYLSRTNYYLIVFYHSVSRTGGIIWRNWIAILRMSGKNRKVDCVCVRLFVVEVDKLLANTNAKLFGKVFSQL